MLGLKLLALRAELPVQFLLVDSGGVTEEKNEQLWIRGLRINI